MSQEIEHPYRVLGIVRDVAISNDLGRFNTAVVRTAPAVGHPATDHMVIYRGLSEPLPVRIQSGCALGHIFGDDECDCKFQFRRSLEYVLEHDNGMVIYTADHDGRGRGIFGKMSVYAQRNAHGGTSREACDVLGLPYDTRDFRQFATVLEAFGVRSIKLLGASSAKAEAMREAGIEISDQLSI